MGKNQQHEQRKRAMGGEGEGAPEAVEGGVDVSFHTPEWHAARVAALNTERMSWEEFKQKAAEKQAMAGDEDDAMRKYRALLDADRAKLLARGTKNTHLKEALGDTLGKQIKKKKEKKHKKKKRKSKDGKKKKKKKAKHSGSSGSSSSSGDD